MPPSGKEEFKRRLDSEQDGLNIEEIKVQVGKGKSASEVVLPPPDIDSPNHSRKESKAPTADFPKEGEGSVHFNFD